MRLLTCLCALAGTLICLPGVAPAAPAPRVANIADVPGLAAYMTERFKDGWKQKQDIFLVRLLDLDEEPDGIDEILLSVDTFDRDYCGNNGCDHEVLVRQGDGSLKAVTSYKGFGLKVADTTTNGVRDLISETLKGNRRFNLAGETSGTRDLKSGSGKNI